MKTLQVKSHNFKYYAANEAGDLVGPGFFFASETADWIFRYDSIEDEKEKETFLLNSLIQTAGIKEKT